MALRQLLRRRPLGVAAGLGVGIRLLWVLLGTGTDRFTMPDSSQYVDLAGRMGAFTATSTPDLQLLSLYRPPAYPAFLWLSSLGDPSRVLLIVLVQVLVGGLVNVALCYRLGDLVAGRAVATVAALLLAVDPVSVSHSLLIASEVLTTTFVIGGLVLIAEAQRRPRLRDRALLAAAAGGALGLGSLVRPVALYLIPLGIVLALVAPGAVAAADGERRRRPLATPASWATAGALLLGAAIPAGAWMARNQAISGRPLYSTVQGENLVLYGAGAAAAERGQIRLRYADGGTADPSINSVDPGIGPRADRAAARALGLDPDRVPASVRLSPRFAAETDRALSAEGLDLLVHHPRGIVIVGAYGGARMLLLPGASANVDQLRPSLRVGPVRALVWAWAIGWVVLVDVGAVVGAFVLRRRTSGWSLALIVVPLIYYLLASAGTFAYVRFRVPVSPLLCILAAAAVVWVDDRRRRQGSGEPSS